MVYISTHHKQHQVYEAVLLTVSGTWFRYVVIATRDIDMNRYEARGKHARTLYQNRPVLLLETQTATYRFTTVDA